MIFGGKNKKLQEAIGDPEIQITSLQAELTENQKQAALEQRAIDKQLKNSFQELNNVVNKRISLDTDAFDKRLKNLLDAAEIKKNPGSTGGHSIFQRPVFKVAFATFVFMLFGVPAYFYLNKSDLSHQNEVAGSKLDENWVGITEELVGANADAWVFGETNFDNVKWKEVVDLKDQQLLASRSKSLEKKMDIPPGDIPVIPARETMDENSVALKREFELSKDNKGVNKEESDMEPGSIKASDAIEKKLWKDVNSSKDSVVRKKALQRLEKIYSAKKKTKELKNVRKILRSLQ